MTGIFLFLVLLIEIIKENKQDAALLKERTGFIVQVRLQGEAGSVILLNIEWDGMRRCSN